mgnify:CR=1 FL=1
MTEVLFYHLERQPLEQVLPTLLEKTLERGWRAVVQAGSAERLDALDMQLWTYRDDSFLPHGTAKDGAAADHPIWLTTGPDNPNAAAVRFLIDGAETAAFDGYERIVYMFDGHDAAGLEKARADWTRAKASGAACTYWQQSSSGRWEKKG